MTNVAHINTKNGIFGMPVYTYFFLISIGKVSRQNLSETQRKVHLPFNTEWLRLPQTYGPISNILM